MSLLVEYDRASPKLAECVGGRGNDSNLYHLLNSAAQSWPSSSDRPHLDHLFITSMVLTWRAAPRVPTSRPQRVFEDSRPTWSSCAATWIAW